MFSALFSFVGVLLTAMWRAVSAALSVRWVQLMLAGAALVVLAYVGITWKREIGSLRAGRERDAKIITGLVADTAMNHAELRVADSIGQQIIVRRDTIIKRERVFVRTASPRLLVDTLNKRIGGGVVLVGVDPPLHGTDSTARLDISVSALRRITGFSLSGLRDSTDLSNFVDSYSKRTAAIQQIGSIITRYQPTTRWTWPWIYYNRWHQLADAYWKVYVPIKPVARVDTLTAK